MPRLFVGWLRLLAASGFAALLLAAPAAAGPAPPLSHAGRWITDARGRVVILHGINMVYKLPPYFPAAVGFGEDDAAFLSRTGFNVVRVGVIWKALEPHPGVYDDDYLSRIEATVKSLARHGILSLLDFHQDLLNERFQGEGAPDWAVQDGGLLNPTLGFPGNYLGNPALQHALNSFWDNAPGPGGVGLQDRFAAAWAHVAARFRGDPAVVGYEEFNEPFPGSNWIPCVNPAGCAEFDAKLTAFSRRVARAIRGVDGHTLVWYEPNVLFNNGTKTLMGAIGDPRAGFAFHDYCLQEPTTGSTAGCDQLDNLVFANAVARAQQQRDALLETEFGATDDLPYLNDMLDRGDRFMVPWIEWAYCGCSDPTTSGPGDKQAIVRQPSRPPAGGNLVLGTLRALVEPYPQVVAGTPTSWGYDRSTRTFTLRYGIGRASGVRSFPAGSVSEISTSAMVYGRRYAVHVAGGRVTSAPGASLLQIASCPRAQTISVNVSPGSGAHGTCPAPRRHRRRPRHRRPHHRLRR